MMFFFVAPLWLGFTFYSLQNRPHLAASIETSAPLAVGHTQYVLPDLRDFPRVPVSHHQLLLGLAPPTATPVEELSTQQSGSPPAHKLQHKHKHEQEQEQEQEQEAGSVKVQGPRNTTIGTSPGSAPPTAIHVQEPLTTQLKSPSDEPHQKYMHEQEQQQDEGQQQEQKHESDDRNEWQAQQNAVGASPDSDYVHKQIQAKPDDIPMMSTTFISQ
jgi:hypothetical protein